MILAAPAAAKSSSSSFLPLLIIIVLFGLFYMTIIRPQRNRQKSAMQTQRHVTPGQRIRTTAGMYGTIISGDDRDVVVEIAPGINVTMLRRAVMDVVPEDDQGGSPISEPEPEPANSAATSSANGTEDQGSSKPADDRGDLTI
jgi:preprotein translocase subunit YajC